MKINQQIVKRVVRKLERSCQPSDDSCRMCGRYTCPKEKAADIKDWYKEHIQK